MTPEEKAALPLHEGSRWEGESVVEYDGTEVEPGANRTTMRISIESKGLVCEDLQRLVRSCSTCCYGDNGDSPDGCSSSCWEPDLSDWEPNRGTTAEPQWRPATYDEAREHWHKGMQVQKYRPARPDMDWEECKEEPWSNGLDYRVRDVKRQEG